MKRTYSVFILGLGLLFFLLFGCDGRGQDNLYPYKNITVTSDDIPTKCRELVDCQMFSCMVTSCWCKQSQPDNGVLYRSNTRVEDNAGAIAVVKKYLQTTSAAYNETSVRAVKLNALFYNVFYSDATNNEHTLTIAIDGTIMETVCGV